MVECVRVQEKKAEPVRRKLVQKKLVHPEYKIERENGFVFFPITSSKGLSGYEVVEREPQKRELGPNSIKEALEGKLSENELEELVTSFDVVGDIAILEIRDSLKEKEKEIADAVLEVHKSINTVTKKASAMKGEYRVRELEVIGGEDKTEAVYRESGCVMKVDLAKVYFSPRLSFERLRVAKKVGPGEKVLVMFAGVGPFALVIAKNQPKATVKAIELNPIGVEYMEKNIALNKMSKQIEAIQGDVKEVVPKRFAGWADRVLMPLPKGAHEFLSEAILACKPGGIIHFYHFEETPGEVEKARKVVEDAAAKAGRKAEFLEGRVVRPYAPTINQVVVDARVL